MIFKVLILSADITRHKLTKVCIQLPKVVADHEDGVEEDKVKELEGKGT